MSNEYEDYLKYKEQHDSRKSGSSINPAVILLIVAVIAVIFIAPLMGGIGYASGGGEVRMFSPSNSSNVNGNYNYVTQINGSRNTVTYDSSRDRDISGDCLAGLITIVTFVLLILAVFLGIGFFKSVY